MHVVSHQAPRTDAQFVLLGVASQQLQVRIAIQRIVEDDLGPVAALGNVLRNVGLGDSSDSGHLLKRCRLRREILWKPGNVYPVPGLAFDYP